MNMISTYILRDFDIFVTQGVTIENNLSHILYRSKLCISLIRIVDINKNNYGCP